MSDTGTVVETAVGWRRSGYVVAILGTEVLVALLGTVDLPGSPGGNVLQLIAYPLGLLLGIVLWLRAPSTGPAVGPLRVFLVLALTMCVLESGRVLIAGNPLSPVAITVVALLLLIWVKPPDRASGQRIVDAMAVILIAAVGIALILESVGVTLSWYRLYPMFDEIIEGDNATYWLPLASVFGLDGRWAGPFPHPNMAGPVGGFLIVVGLCRRGWLQWGAIGAGMLVLLLTGSRTSTIAALVGSLVVLIAVALVGWPHARAARAALLGSPALLVSFLVATAVHAAPEGVVPSPGSTVEQFSSLTGRTAIWPVYVRIWQESPWFGVPDVRIAQAIQGGELPGWAITAHNLLLDALVRFGVAGAMLVVLAIGVAVLMALRAARSGYAVGLGTLAVIVTSGLTETLVFWRVLAASTILLVLAVIASVPVDPTERLVDAGAESRPDEDLGGLELGGEEAIGAGAGNGLTQPADDGAGDGRREKGSA